MSEYDFEYTDYKFELKLWLISYGLLFGLLISIPLGLHTFLPHISKNFPAILIVILVIGIPLFYFLYNKKKIKKTGYARILIDSLYIKLPDTDKTISFYDIKMYSISNVKNTMRINLYFKDQSKFRLICNTNFCDSENFKNLQWDLENKLILFQEEQNISIDKVPSIYTKKKAPYILLILTIGVILLGVFTKFPAKIISIALGAGLLGAWIQYFIERKPKK